MIQQEERKKHNQKQRNKKYIPHKKDNKDKNKKIILYIIFLFLSLFSFLCGKI